MWWIFSNSCFWWPRWVLATILCLWYETLLDIPRKKITGLLQVIGFLPCCRAPYYWRTSCLRNLCQRPSTRHFTAVTVTITSHRRIEPGSLRKGGSRGMGPPEYRRMMDSSETFEDTLFSYFDQSKAQGIPPNDMFLVLIRGFPGAR